MEHAIFLFLRHRQGKLLSYSSLPEHSQLSNIVSHGWSTLISALTSVSDVKLEIFMLDWRKKSNFCLNKYLWKTYDAMTMICLCNRAHQCALKAHWWARLKYCTIDVVLIYHHVTLQRMLSAWSLPRYRGQLAIHQEPSTNSSLHQDICTGLWKKGPVPDQAASHTGDNIYWVLWGIVCYFRVCNAWVRVYREPYEAVSRRLRDVAVKRFPLYSLTFLKLTCTDSSNVSGR